MDPGSVVGAALSSAATSAASKGVESSHKKWGMKGVGMNLLAVVGLLALFQIYRTRSFRGITG